MRTSGIARLSNHRNHHLLKRNVYRTNQKNDTLALKQCGNLLAPQAWKARPGKFFVTLKKEVYDNIRSLQAKFQCGFKSLIVLYWFVQSNVVVPRASFNPHK